MWTRLRTLLRRLTADLDPVPLPTVDADKLIHRVDLTIDASCPCGSTLIHHLTLMTTIECPRCGRTIAIRSISYLRTTPAAIPDPVISIGWVVTKERLRLVQTRGVH